MNAYVNSHNYVNAISDEEFIALERIVKERRLKIDVAEARKIQITPEERFLINQGREMKAARDIMVRTDCRLAVAFLVVKWNNGNL